MREGTDFFSVASSTKSQVNELDFFSSYKAEKSVCLYVCVCERASDPLSKLFSLNFKRDWSWSNIWAQDGRPRKNANLCSSNPFFIIFPLIFPFATYFSVKLGCRRKASGFGSPRGALWRGGWPPESWLEKLHHSGTTLGINVFLLRLNSVARVNWDGGLRHSDRLERCLQWRNFTNSRRRSSLHRCWKHHRKLKRKAVSHLYLTNKIWNLKHRHSSGRKKE